MNTSDRIVMGRNGMDGTFVIDGHEYRDADGHICNGAGELVGAVLRDVAKHYWIVEPAGEEDGWLVHVNEPDARETAIRGLLSRTY